MENQIRSNFKKAMNDLIEKACEQEKLHDNDIDWIIRLTEELVFRINSLTPKRTDLHIQLQQSIDLTLMKQMLANQAFDESDFKQVVDTFINRLKLLCAPSQDSTLITLHQHLFEMPFAKAIPYMIMQCNEIIDEIKRLETEFKESVKNGTFKINN